MSSIYLRAFSVRIGNAEQPGETTRTLVFHVWASSIARARMMARTAAANALGMPLQGNGAPHVSSASPLGKRVAAVGDLSQLLASGGDFVRLVGCEDVARF